MVTLKVAISGFLCYRYKFVSRVKENFWTAVERNERLKKLLN
ncbi:hypothetical protein [Paenibacillus dakarensis]|nr:hypothetical protein [Paenibacillus dakarensis]